MNLTRKGDGWAYRVRDRGHENAHYLRRGRPLCGHSGFDGSELREPEDGRRHRDDCRKCLAKLDA